MLLTFYRFNLRGLGRAAPHLEMREVHLMTRKFLDLLRPAKTDPSGAPRLVVWAAVSSVADSAMSANVQVFGRRDDAIIHALWWPASKKRQGTKSREVVSGGAAGAMGI